jgi:uncharacterized membrane protein YfcA
VIASWAIFATQITWEQAAALGALGFALGIVSGLFGVGGGFLSTPLLRVLFGVSYPVAIGSSLVNILGTSAAGTISHYRRGNVKPKAVMLIGIGSVAGVLIGDAILRGMVHVFGDHYTSVMHGLYIVLLGLISWRVSRGREEAPTDHGLLHRLPLGPRVDLGGAHLSGLSAPGLAGLGVLGGILAGAMGIGGGVLFVPILILAVGFTAHQAVGTSLGTILVASIVGVAVKGWHGEVDMGIGMALLVGSSIGAQAGAALCEKLHARRLKQYFAVLVLLAAVLVAADLIRLLT